MSIEDHRERKLPGQLHCAYSWESFLVQGPAFVFCTTWYLDLVENKCLPIVNVLPSCRHADV